MGIFSKLFGIDKSENITLTYGDVVILWLFENGRDINDNDYPSYFKYKYNIEASQRVKVLQKIGYISPANTEKILKYYKLDQLKELSKKNNIQSTGKKQTLIDRLITIDGIENQLSSSIYCLSAIGEVYLNQNYDIIKYHKDSFDLDVSEFSTLLTRYGSYDSAILHSLDKNEKYHRERKDWGLYRCVKFNRARFAHLHEDFESEMMYYIEVFYCDLSGYGNSNTRDTLKELIIAPGIVSFFPKHKQYYNSDMVTQAIYDCDLPKHYFSDKAFKIIIERLVNGDIMDLKETLKIRLDNK